MGEGAAVGAARLEEGRGVVEWEGHGVRITTSRTGTGGRWVCD